MKMMSSLSDCIGWRNRRVSEGRMKNYRRYSLVTVGLVIACAPGEERERSPLDVPLTAVEELRVGSVDDPELAFTTFSDLEVGPRGEIYTAHRQEHDLRMFDSSGAFVRTIGREGAGPGEFENVRTIGILHDTLWALDYGTMRFSFFSLSGEFVRSRPARAAVSRDRTEIPPFPTRILSDGSIMGAPSVPSSRVASGEIRTAAIFRLDSTGKLLDTLAVYSLTNSQWAVTDTHDPPRFASYRSQPFADGPLVKVSQYGPIIIEVLRRAATNATVDSFTVTARGFDSDTTFSLTISYTPVELDTDIIDSIAEGFGKGIADFASVTTDRATEWARKSLYVPQYHPPVSAVVIGRDGNVWLQRERAAGPTIEWMILSESGQILGRVSLPKRFRLMYADGYRVWGMELDELDVPYVVRYRIGDIDTD